MGLNNCVLLGRITRDPELRYTAGTGNAMARFTVAINRNYNKEKKEEEMTAGRPVADFIGCIAWGKTAELVASYLAKGRQVAIQGRIQTSSYEGQDGNRVYRTDVVADRVEFIGGNSNNQGNNQSSNDNFGLGDDAFPIDDEDMGDVPW